jgi:hypothetical protein
MATKRTLATKESSKLLNFMANTDPVLREAIDLPQQGADIPEIGKIIMSNTRYKNAFINAVNVIALTLIIDDAWANPWEDFTNQGQIRYGQSVREMILDLVDAEDYNENMNNPTHFLETVVPNVLNYMHEINFQKFYKSTVNDQEIALAFYDSTGIFDFIQAVYNNLRKSYVYDRYIVDKYQIQRRLVDGTIPSKEIPNFDTNTVRENVSIMKEYSNNMTFLSPNYNPAGLRLATPFDKQRTIISTGLEAKISTEVLATSYFRNDAELKTKLALIDGFAENDWSRLAKLLKDQYKPFTEKEIERLQSVVSLIISDNFFKDYYYALDGQADTINTDFKNPETLSRTMWLHAWRIFSTSPFEQCLAFTKDTNSVTSVTVSPATATITKGQTLQLKAIVEVTGITNKSVAWSIDEDSASKNVTINQDGVLKVASTSEATSVTVTATSVFDKTKTGTATITVASGS